MPSGGREFGLLGYGRFRALFVVVGAFVGGLGNIGGYFFFQPPRLEQLTVVDRLLGDIESDSNTIRVYMRHVHEPYSYPADWPNASALASLRDETPRQRTQLWVDGGGTIWQVVAHDEHIVRYEETSRHVREYRWTGLGFGSLLLFVSIVSGVWIWWRDWR